ncbi:hypothetical protein [Pseudomonas sp. N040]|uniref:hypothetical protein n=1 Tax=Pseudomonas sp. N040 TaxID=2785325 RepID=UPI0018A2D5F4|nr:hypothetical protein [Pseudomonas sp. N040]MBF7730977.1 hypothetical protein [Pseudomonas sp. N040]MBW7014620.1 hypothetical protein [Pseudomonas sp. N040]
MLKSQWMFGALGAFATASALAAQPPAPMETRSAIPVAGPMLSASAASFSDMELDEVDDFDGWTGSLGFALPVFEHSQLRLDAPLYTDGDGRATAEPGEESYGPVAPGDYPDLDIEGDGGVWDYTTLEFQSQIWDETSHSYVLGWYAGFGQVRESLDAKHDGRLYDVVNHKGDVYLAGMLAEGDGGWGRWYMNAGARFYRKSDDLNPAGDDDFDVADLRLANRFAPLAENLYPVLEVTYLGDFADVNQASLLPELLYAPNDTVNLKAGLTVGAGDGNQFGGQAEIDFFF